jgi:hypothetical protein
MIAAGSSVASDADPVKAQPGSGRTLLAPGLAFFAFFVFLGNAVWAQAFKPFD